MGSGLLLYLYSSGGQAPTPTILMLQGSYQSLEVQKEGYLPNPVVVVLGVNNTVTWENEDSAPHTAHSDIPGFDSRIVASRGYYTFTFAREGVWPYHCDLHPWRIGKIVVKG